ncbi:MAG: non-ribosomal peptide synthetase, partial [Micromonosporaceae bacterium]|nr:non-ribosomal peptide synthetase [Micromonosporaceae bacterium]
TVGAEDSFFTLGGDSIMSMLLVSRARQAGLTITARQVFEHKTPAALAKAGVSVTEDDSPVTHEPDVPVGTVPLTPVMLELAEKAGAAALSGAVSQSMLIETPVGLEYSRLVAATQALLDHHDMLRARLADGHLVVPAKGEAASAADCVTRVDGADGVDLGEAARQAAERLDPAAGVMLQAVWFDAGPDLPGRLLLVAHHLVVDGVSWRILLPDLVTAHEGGDLEPGTSFRRWAGTLAEQAVSAERLAELPVWTRLLDGPESRLGKRPLDPTVDTPANGLHHASLTTPVATAQELLTSVPAALDAGVDEVLLAGLVAAVGEWRRRRRRNLAGGVVVNVEGHGRVPLSPDMDLTRTVGWFTNSQPVRIDPGTSEYAEIRAGGAATRAVVGRVREQMRAVPGDGLGYGLLRYLNPDTAEAMAELPSAQIGFNYLGRFTAGSAEESPGGPASGSAWQPVGDNVLAGTGDADTPVSHVLHAEGLVRDLPGGPELTLSLTTPAGVLDQAAVSALAEGWVAMLSGIAASAADAVPDDTESPLVSLDQDQLHALQSKLSEEKD